MSFAIGKSICATAQSNNVPQSIGTDEITLFFEKEFEIKVEEVFTLLEKEEVYAASNYNYVPKECVLSILKEIFQKNGKSKDEKVVELFKLLLSNIKEEKYKKITFLVLPDRADDPEFRKIRDVYAFQSENTIKKAEQGEILISLSSNKAVSAKRIAFDGNNLSIIRVCDEKDAEVYHVKHELVHVLSFLEVNKQDTKITPDKWECHKKDWDAFLDTPRMEPIKKDPEQKIGVDEVKNLSKSFFTQRKKQKIFWDFKSVNKKRLSVSLIFFRKNILT